MRMEDMTMENLHKGAEAFSEAQNIVKKEKSS